MRELNECKSEVFRRSENRIRERRMKRKRVFALCIPLVLCMTVCSVMILPVMMPAKFANDAVVEDMVEEDASGSYDCSYTEVVIRNTEDPCADSQKITDMAEINKIFSAIYNLYGNADSAGGVLFEADADDMQVGESSEQARELSSRRNGCVIIFRTEEGSENAYTLDGNELLNVNENTKMTLTDSQIAELKAVLGISE